MSVYPNTSVDANRLEVELDGQKKTNEKDAKGFEVERSRVSFS